MAAEVRKAVIPVAGLGTRMLPASKAIPKEMLPIADKPLIQYVVQECVDAGIREIVLVTHSSKNSIENHFDRSFELESILEQRVKRQLLAEMQAICPPGVTIMHVRQGEPKGLGHAIACAYPLVGDNPFAVVLPDILVDDQACSTTQDNLAAMVRAYGQDQISRILIEKVAKEDVEHYGIVACEEPVAGAASGAAISHIVEKPRPQDAPSQYAVVGRYVLSEAIWPLFAKTPVGVGGEIQLSDTLDLFLEKQPLLACLITGRSHDCGEKLGYMKAFVEYSLRHPTLAPAFRSFLAQLLTAKPDS